MSELGIPDEWAALGWPVPVVGSLVWFLGPSANALRKNVAQWTDEQSTNLLRLGQKVQRRLKQESESGGEDTNESIHPRVAKTVLDEAAWINDDVHQEYLAGVLVNSKSPQGRDDAGAYITRIVAQMTAGQIRLHEAMYSCYVGRRSDASEETPPRFTHPEEMPDLAVAASMESMENVASAGIDGVDKQSALANATHGLLREGLIQGSSYPLGGTDRTRYQLVPTLLGATLFGWAMYTPKLGPLAIEMEPSRLALYRPPYVHTTIDPSLPRFEDVVVGRYT